MAAHAEELAKLLAPPEAPVAQDTPFGVLQPPLGLARLKVSLPRSRRLRYY